jgi:hypothetical protein
MYLHTYQFSQIGEISTNLVTTYQLQGSLVVEKRNSLATIDHQLRARCRLEQLIPREYDNHLESITLFPSPIIIFVPGEK